MRPAPWFYLLAACWLAFSSGLAHAHTATPIPSAYGTATIDGVMSPGEWDAAAPRNVFTALTGSQFYIMDDHVNLYLGLYVPDPTISSADAFWVRIDSEHDGATQFGDDEVGVTGTDGFFDSHFTGSSWGTTDGNTHGAGACTPIAGGAFYEMRHPLNSGDPKDLFVSLGDTIGVCVYYRNNASIQQGDIYPTGCLTSGAVQNTYVDYKISSGQVDADPRAVLSAMRLAVLPNPVRVGAELAIRYQVPAGGRRVDLAIYSIAGRRVVDLGPGSSAPGEHVFKYTWPARATRLLGPGVYFVRASYEGLGARSAPVIVQ